MRGFLLPAVALALLAPQPASAYCRTALTLAVDVSASVSNVEYVLQMEGLASALEDRAVQSAMLQIPGASVALQVFEWSGVGQQLVVSDWLEVRGIADLDRVAAAIRGHRRAYEGGRTALGEALEFGRLQLGRAPRCEMQKIDVSGDGRSNAGVQPQHLHAIRDFGDITVNGLAIESDDDGLGRYYRFFVIRGPDAFVERAADFDDYARAIREKLIREMGVPQLGMVAPRGG